MATKRNTARVAVQAQPCQKQAASTAVPTWQQTVLTALAFAQDSLERLNSAIATDKDWGDSDVEADVCLSMDVVLQRIKNMRANPPAEVASFEREWFESASIVNLCMHVFSRTDTYYFRSLESVKKLFEVFADAVVFVNREGRCGK